MESFTQNINPEIETTTSEQQTDLVHAQQEITRLTEANKHKDELISITAHQLRGPLAAIKGYASLVMEGDYGQVPQTMTEPLSIIFKAADSLTKTVNDFLDVSRIEQGAMRYYRRDFDLCQLADEVVNEMKISINNANLDLELDMANEPLIIHGDKAKIKHVFLNLIDNAIKYTKSGWLKISLKKIRGQVVFTIKDSGVGIKPETMPRLFEKFGRCTEADKTNTSGLGLGLYVAKNIIETHNGKITAVSAGEGKGSEFRVELPSL